ncbi:MFS transporter [Nonomuraea sp. 3N208]|uniref:MFS transporter n=1 Tax=Nonomuraea sp. 3N208 TaxID=3457421 RepID=UPI003FD301B2
MPCGPSSVAAAFDRPRSAHLPAVFALGGAAGAAGWRAPFWAYAVSLLLAPAMAAFLPTPRPTTISKSAAEGGTTEAASAPEPAKRPFPWRPLAGTCALTVFGSVVFYTLTVHMSYLLDDIGVTDPGTIGLATAVASAATVAGAVTFTKLGRTPDVWLPAVFAVCALGFAVIWFAPNAAVLIIGAVINCFGCGVMLPSLLTLAMSKLEYADRGRGTGLWTATFFIGQFICPLVVLALASAAGSRADAVGVLALATSVVAAGLGLFASRRRAVDGPEPHKQMAG